MTTPNVQAPEWASAQGSPWTPHNKALRLLDAFAAHSIIEDRNLAAPPGACADGARYLVAAAPTGLWAGQAGTLAIAVGVNASNGWYFVTVAVEGVELWVRDENIKIIHNGSAWVDAASLGAPFEFMVAASDETTALTVGDGKVTFPWPANATLTQVVGFLTGASDSSGPVEFDVTRGGVSIFSTLPQIDPGSQSSEGGMFEGVISTANIDRHDIMAVDVVQPGDGANGLKILFIGTRR